MKYLLAGLVAGIALGGVVILTRKKGITLDDLLVYFAEVDEEGIAKMGDSLAAWLTESIEAARAA